jgi:hypothetical protein
MSCSPCSPSNKRCPYPPLRPRGFVPRPCPGRLVRAHASHAVENGMDSRMLDSRPSAMLLDRSGRGRGGRKRSSCSICLVRSSQVQVRPSSSSALMQHPGPSIHFKQPLCEGRWQQMGRGDGKIMASRASQAEFRTILRTDKKPRTEPKLAPLRQPAKERPSSHKITEHIRSAAASFTGSVHPEKVFFRGNTKTSGSCLHVNKAVRTNFNTKLDHNHNARAHSF